MRTLSTGQPATLGSYLKNAKAMFGEKSAATKFVQEMVDNHEKGEDEEVVAHESQFLHLLGQKHIEWLADQHHNELNKKAPSEKGLNKGF